MKYMMLVCMNPAIEAAEADIEKGVEAWIAETDGKGLRLEEHPLDRKDLDEAIEIAAKHPPCSARWNCGRSERTDHRHVVSQGLATR